MEKKVYETTFGFLKKNKIQDLPTRTTFFFLVEKKKLNKYFLIIQKDKHNENDPYTRKSRTCRNLVRLLSDDDSDRSWYKTP
jgi:hypothetical protein